MSRSLYVSYDGMGDHLGQSQVIPYLEGLAERGRNIRLVSFEKPESHPTRPPSSHPGIRWTPMRYHARPRAPATAYDLARGAAAVAGFGLRDRPTLVHTRSYVAAAMALPWCRASNTPLLFDMRGMWADERVEDGSWPAGGGIDRAVRRLEGRLLADAAAVTVLTNAMAQHIASRRRRPGAPLVVIPTCTDLDHFRADVAPDPELAAELAGASTLVYLGALGGRNLIHEMGRFYLAWRDVAPNPRLLVLSGHSVAPLRAVLANAGAEDEFIHRSVPRERVPGAVRCGQAGMFFYRGTRGTLGVAPTKLGEMLGLGLPMAGNPVGDVSDVLTEDIGVTIDTFSDADLHVAAARLFALSKDVDTAAKARAQAELWFSLERGIEAYADLYDRLERGLPGRGEPFGVWPRTET